MCIFGGGNPAPPPPAPLPPPPPVPPAPPAPLPTPEPVETKAVNPQVRRANLRKLKVNLLQALHNLEYLLGQKLTLDSQVHPEELINDDST